MLSGNDTTFAVAALWLLALVLAWLSVGRWAGRRFQAHPILIVAGAAAVARIVPTLVLDRGLPFDIEAHWWVGNLVLAGQDVYTAPLAQNRYPYPPLHMVLSALMVALSGHDRALFLILDKLIPGLCGVGLAVGVWAAARRLGRGPDVALRCGLLYALNPLPVLVSSYHGQFEEIPLLFIGLALLLLLGRQPSRSATVLSALLLGVAVAYKTWPLLFVPPLLLLARGWRRRVIYAALTPLPLALSLGLYGLAFGRAGLLEAVHRIMGYKGSNGFCWGYVSVIRSCWVHPERLQPNGWVLTLNSRLLLLALVTVGVLLLWRQRPLEGIVTIPLAFYLFSPGWGPDYSIWVVPFALLYALPLAQRYTLVVLPVVAVTYFDSLYAAYNHNAFSWAVLKPTEAGLGLLAWCGIAALLVGLYLTRQPLPEMAPRTAHPLGWAGGLLSRLRRAERAALPD